ncbi:MAG: tail protein X [Proteobacteria bacterium]|nr:tail protein X [Pseudomonadota bacterium]
MLDAICQQVYGASRGHTEQVLAANPGLADHGPVLPAGLVIELPAAPPPEPVISTIRLWD